LPELPDVEVFKRYLDATSLHKKIDAVEVKNAKILRGISTETLRRKLKGRTFLSTYRHGKILFVGIDKGLWLLFHFGMTGRVKYFKPMEEEPRHTRLLLAFSEGTHLAYESQRMLGRVELIENVEDYIAEKKLGPDALDDALDFQRFKEVLGSRRGVVKSVLMNQKALAGIGNVYSDEILFQAGLHPKSKVGRLKEKDLEKLFKQMKGVLKTAVARRADPEDFPKHYLTPHRDGNRKCPGCGTRLESVKISGRTSYGCPRCQEILS
jgi:formamidopyrimidine-DNA glycosylase